MTPLLLALDPSLACAGALLVTLDGRNQLVACATIETKRARSFGKLEALEAHHDAGHRAVRLFGGLCDLLDAYPAIALFALETPLGAQDAGAAWGMARAHAATRCAVASRRPDLRPIAISQYEAKLRSTGAKKPGDAKGDVMRGVRRRFGPGECDAVLAAASLVTTQQREAVYDAGAVAIATLRLRAARLVIKDYRRAASAAAPMGDTA